MAIFRSERHTLRGRGEGIEGGKRDEFRCRFQQGAWRQTSDPRLGDKLQIVWRFSDLKGILSVDEAKELKAVNATNSVADFNKALGAKFPTPDWVTSYKLYGDFQI